MKAKMLYKDKAGNRLYKKHIKTRNIDQYYVKNREGKVVSPIGFRKIVKKAGYDVGSMKKPKYKRGIGITTTKLRRRK